jgi:hypothetical protein
MLPVAANAGMFGLAGPQHLQPMSALSGATDTRNNNRGDHSHCCLVNGITLTKPRRY